MRHAEPAASICGPDAAPMAWKCIQKMVHLKIAGFACGSIPPDALKECNQQII
jgi:hypothetical protein